MVPRLRDSPCPGILLPRGRISRNLETILLPIHYIRSLKISTPQLLLLRLNWNLLKGIRWGVMYFPHACKIWGGLSISVIDWRTSLIPYRVPVLVIIIGISFVCLCTIQAQSPSNHQYHQVWFDFQLETLLGKICLSYFSGLSFTQS